jgi:putative transposase
MGTRHHVALENQAYFVTARTAQRTPLFRDRSVAELLLQELQRCRERLGFLLLSFVVMPDHVYLLLVPGSSADLPRVMQHIKGGFGRVLNVAWGSSGAVWQQRFFEGAARTQVQLERWIRYIEENPVKAGLASSPSAYPFSSAGGALTADLERYLGGEVAVPG